MFPFSEQQNILEKSFNEQLELNSPVLPKNPYNLIPLSPPNFMFDSLNDFLILPSVSTTDTPTHPTAPITGASFDHRPTMSHLPSMNNTSCEGMRSVGRKRSARKDRHSKICTATGPRDRRMRLSLDVARKFFNLQDMLGFDKPSKTVQWLLTKSKTAIKEITAVSAQKLCVFGVQSPKHESSTSDCEDASTVSNPKGKSAVEVTDEQIKKCKTKRAATKTPRKTTFHPMLTKEARTQARARARERTSEKKRMSCLASSSLSIPFDSTTDKGLHYLKQANPLEVFPETELRCSSLHNQQFMKMDSQGEFSISTGDFGQIQLFESNQNIAGIDVDAVNIFQEEWDIDRAYFPDLQFQKSLQNFGNTPTV